MGQALRRWIYTITAGPLLAGGLSLAAGLAGPSWAADIEEGPAADVRSAQRAIRSCTDQCASDCRAGRADCANGGGENDDRCRAQFQICVRRCVVSCGSK
jgi:hypothetical protein